MSFADQIRQECKRIQTALFEEEKKRKEKKLELLKEECDRIEVKIKEALNDNKLKYVVNVPEGVDATDLRDALAFHKGIGPRAIQIEYHGHLTIFFQSV